MKKLLGIWVLGLLLITPSLADDIRDFQIEGMSVGDSLLHYFSEEEITEKKKYFYRNKKFAGIIFNNHPSFSIYEDVDFTYKPKDKKYIIHNIKGNIYYRNNIKECIKKKNEITKDISETFGDEVKFFDYGTYNHGVDKTGNSKATSVDFIFKNGNIMIYCMDWSEKLTEKNRWFDSLTVTIATKKFMDFINNEAYK